MRKPIQSLSLSLLFFFVVLSQSSSLLAQGARVRATVDGVERTDDEREADAEDGDNPGAREEWFRSGRRAAGEHAADLLHRAFRQKQALSSTAPSGDQPATIFTFNPQQGTASGTGFTGATYPGTWTSLGPAPIASDSNQNYGAVVGRMTSVAVDQGDKTGNTVYIGAAFGGAWKSTNAAASDPTTVQWKPLIDDQPTLAVGALTVQPGTTGSSAVVLIGTGESNSSGDSYYGMGILRSTDGGSTWTLIKTADNGAKTFVGLGASSFAWNGNTVVVGMGSTNGKRYGSDSVGGRGIYYSSDAGATWHYANVLDVANGATLTEGTVTSVVYNPGSKKFYAFYRYHGLYESADGQNWIRSTQPDASSSLTIQNCPTSQPTPNPTQNCPLYRGELALQPVTNSLYAVYVDANDIDQGVYAASVQNGLLSPWQQLRSGPCKDPSQPGVCPSAKIGNNPNPIWNTTGGGNPGIEEVNFTTTALVPGSIVQGDYNLWIGAVPTANGTDLLVGTRNVYKCSLASTSNCSTAGAWQNLTFVYDCNPTAGPSGLHPDQHGFDFNLSQPVQQFFVNDGGVYRALNGTSISNGTCSSANPFDNLNRNVGSVSEMVSFSQHPSNQNVLLGGLQDNGSPAFTSGSGLMWQTANGGDGGYNEIDPAHPDGIWYTENTGVSIQQCDATNKQPLPNGPGISNAEACTPGTFGLPPYDNGGSLVANIGAPQVAHDQAEFYTPYILDPANTSNLIVGTCRLWRGPGVGGGTWVDPTLGPNKDISPIFDKTASSCASGTSTTKVRAIAAGGPAVNGISQVIYVGLEGAGTATDSGGNLGHVFVNTQADVNTGTHGAANGWKDVTGNIAATLSANGTSYGPYPVSSISIDPHDATGHTAYVTVEGFGVAHVLRTTDAGTTWTDLSSNLPDAPADSIAVDPDDANLLYLGTDVGAFISVNGGTSWDILGSGLPNVPVTKIRVFGSNAAQPKLLRASTYGRGLWQFALPLPPPADLSPSTLNFGNVQLKATSSAQVATFTNNASTAVTVSQVSLGAGSEFMQSNNCSSVPAFGKCQITLNLVPQTLGAKSDTLTVTYGSSQTLTVALTGTAVVSSISLSPSSLTFSGTVQNTTASQTVTVTNTGTASATITGFSLPAGFSQNGGTCAAGTVLAGGANCTIAVAFTPTSTGQTTGNLVVTDSSGASQSVALTANASDFSVAAGNSGSSQTVNAGQPANYSLNLTSVNGFSGSVTLACSGGLPTGTACQFSPSGPVTVGASGATVTLTISSTARASKPAPAAGMLGTPGSPNWPATGLFILGSLATLALLARLRPIRVPARAFAFSAAFGLLIIAPGCGGGGGGSTGTTTITTPVVSNGTPAGTYTVTVTATSGNRTEPISLTLKVN